MDIPSSANGRIFKVGSTSTISSVLEDETFNQLVTPEEVVERPAEQPEIGISADLLLEADAVEVVTESSNLSEQLQVLVELLE